MTESLEDRFEAWRIANEIQEEAFISPGYMATDMILEFVEAIVLERTEELKAENEKLKRENFEVKTAITDLSAAIKKLTTMLEHEGIYDPLNGTPND